jgi:hypothetical protein
MGPDFSGSLTEVATAIRGREAIEQRRKAAPVSVTG